MKEHAADSDRTLSSIVKFEEIQRPCCSEMTLAGHIVIALRACYDVRDICRHPHATCLSAMRDRL